MADYVKHRMKGFFDLLIGDEVHEYKGRGSAQGVAAGVLADACGKSLTLTGTLLGGYSSTLFHLLYRFSPEIRTEFGHSEERPGLAPSALFHLTGSSVFLRLPDVASGLPPYEEQVLLSTMDREPDATGLSQRGAYDRVFNALRHALALALAKGSKAAGDLPADAARLPRRLHAGRDGLRPRHGHPHRAGPAAVGGEALPQGEALVDLVAAERLEGRKVLVYATHTGTRDITGRMGTCSPSTGSGRR